MPWGATSLWSDIPGNKQLRWLEESGHVSEQFRMPSNNSNGNTFDFQGRQISCEHLTHALVRYGFDGKREVLVDKSPGGHAVQMRRMMPWCIRTTVPSGSPTPATAV